MCLHFSPTDGYVKFVAVVVVVALIQLRLGAGIGRFSGVLARRDIWSSVSRIFSSHLTSIRVVTKTLVFCCTYICRNRGFYYPVNDIGIWKNRVRIPQNPISYTGMSEGFVSRCLLFVICLGCSNSDLQHTHTQPKAPNWPKFGRILVEGIFQFNGSECDEFEAKNCPDKIW